MDVIGWLAWMLLSILGVLWSILWFLIAGWISTLLQIALLVVFIYVLKYGWQRAPAEIWRRTRGFALFFWNWIRAREAQPAAAAEGREVIHVSGKEFGDINISTLLSLLMVAGLVLVAQL